MLNISIAPRYLCTLILTCVILSGCATTSDVNLLETLSPATVLKQDEGVVIVRVMHAKHRQLEFNQVTIVPENLNASETIKPERLQAIENVATTGTVFMSPVKSGRYALNSVRAFYIFGERWYSHFASTDAQMGTFEVKPGEVVDLGTIIYYPKPQDDMYVETLFHIPANNPGEILTRHAPYYSFDQSQVRGWLEDEQEEDRETLYASVAQNPISFANTYQAPDETIYFLAKFGVLVIRDANGDWDIDAVDTNQDLISVAVNSRGDMAVGGHEGTLFWKPEGQDWQDRSQPKDSIVRHLKFTDDDTLFMATLKDNRLTISSTQTDNFEWQQRNSFDFNSGWANYQPLKESAKKSKRTSKRTVDELSILTIDDKHFITVYAMHDPDFFGNTIKSEIYQFDPESWVVYEIEDEPEFSAVVPAGLGELAMEREGFWSLGDSQLYKYNSQTQTKTEINNHFYVCNKNQYTLEQQCPLASKSSPSKKKPVKRSFTFASTPIFLNETDGYAVVGVPEYDKEKGERVQKIKFAETKDAGASWMPSTHSLPEPYCHKLVGYVKTHLLLSCSGSTGDFYESFDAGASWEHVRQQENF
ncbi:hypothetical protein [Echinimonas agarilytica]|uniref:Uncharacterized protein n=1 Tax=Echinimonas agarilytica TaxID=1215918 RepID=A0AA42B7Q9_9GAMM|nr:hypothetical protein [Echinimonas agarilytica]MCM2680047.1 hypothetical protein [Echinimonas agarilytica]